MSLGLASLHLLPSLPLSGSRINNPSPLRAKYTEGLNASTIQIACSASLNWVLTQVALKGSGPRFRKGMVFNQAFIPCCQLETAPN